LLSLSAQQGTATWRVAYLYDECAPLRRRLYLRHPFGRPSPEWILKVPELNWLPAMKRMIWYISNVRWCMRTAWAIVYNEGRKASPSKWHEARDYVLTMGD